MDLAFRSPLGALVVVGVVLPLAALLVFEQRAERVRTILHLPAQPARTHGLIVGALFGVALLLGLAATQPVLARSQPRRVRADAEAYVVFDVSRSMRASEGPTRPTRLERAKRVAIRLRESLPEVRFGVASFTNVALPHLFPTVSQRVFEATVEHSVQINEPRPPGMFAPSQRGTDLRSIAALGANGYFPSSAMHRLVVVFSDGESVLFYPGAVGAAYRQRPPIRLIFVHVWGPRERIYLRGRRVDPGYRPDPVSGDIAAQLAAATDGRLSSDHDLSAIVSQARADLGSGETRKLGEERSRTPLAPWVIAAAIVPLGLILRRRNL